MYSGLYN